MTDGINREQTKKLLCDNAVQGKFVLPTLPSAENGELIIIKISA